MFLLKKNVTGFLPQSCSRGKTFPSQQMADLLFLHYHNVTGFTTTFLDMHGPWSYCSSSTPHLASLPVSQLSLIWFHDSCFLNSLYGRKYYCFQWAWVISLNIMNRVPSIFQQMTQSHPSFWMINFICIFFHFHPLMDSLDWLPNLAIVKSAIINTVLMSISIVFWLYFSWVHSKEWFCYVVGKI